MIYPWTAPDDGWDDDEDPTVEPYQVFQNMETGNQITEHPLLYEHRKKNKAKKGKYKVRASADQVPTLDLLRIWDRC